MKILSIHDGHNASICYLCDGVVKYLLLEERFSRVKNQGGFPKNAFEWLKRQPDFELNYLDFIVIGCFDLPVYDRKTKNDLIHRTFFLSARILPKSIVSSKRLIKPYLRLVGIKRRKQLKRYALKYGFEVSKIRQVEHHVGHCYAALYGSGFTKENEPILIFTLDNSGDGLSSTVSIWNPDMGYKRLHENQSLNSLGELYARVTELLGMKAGEHEHKIMGMSPYVSDEHSEKVFRLLKQRYMDLDRSGLKFINKACYDSFLLKKMKKDFFGQRFDNICGGFQRHFEYLVVKWIRNWADKTGIRRAVFGGGCFMNVKANMLIASLADFDDVFFMPSAGDESCAIGGAYKIHEESCSIPISPLGNLYKGPRYSNDDVEKVLLRYSDKIAYRQIENIEKAIADLLADYKIVGRFKENAEWGARALGNRSILCRADDLRIIHKLNKSIKMRDFWMPFAPSLLAEEGDNYIINPKNICASYMSVAFQTKKQAKSHLAAALHPFDYTCRPHLVCKEWSKDYHRLISYFKERTGIGGILNTSFNLHGSPIVGSPEDAIKTLIDSNLDFIAIEDCLVWAKDRVQTTDF